MNTEGKLEKYFLGYLVENPTDMAAFLSCFLPIIFCAFYFKSCWSNYRILFFYSLLILIFDLISGYFAAFSRNNHLIILTFFVFEAVFLVIFYIQLIENKLYNKIFIMLGLIVIAAITINIFNGTSLVSDYSISIQSLCFISISLVSYYYILSNSVSIILGRSVLFWVTTGSFVYFSGIFFVYMFITTLLSEKSKNMGDLFIIANILVVIFRIFLAIAISKTKYTNLRIN